MSEIIVETCGVTKKYGNLTAVSEINIRVAKGSICALVGQNGAGKTTLLKLLCGLTPATSGQISLFGENSPRGLRNVRARTGAMIETPAFLPYLSAKDNLEYLRIQRGSGNRKSAEDALHFIGLDHAGKKPFSRFSLGMKQRLGLALAVMDNAELLILDEPINGLDPIGIREFREIILRMNKDNGTTVLISSHILGELSQIATDFGFIDRGKLLQYISAAELREKCRGVLCIETDDPVRASAVLREKTGCAEFTCSENTLRFAGQIDEPEVYARSLAENGVAVTRVCRKDISLEEYFIDLLRGEKANA